MAIAGELPPVPAGQPRRTSAVVATSPACKPLKDLYENAVASGITSWDQIEPLFLDAMGAFDTTLTATAQNPDSEASKSVAGDLQNGKGDFFNDLLALILERCSGIENLYARGSVPGLIVEKHNLDGVYPMTGEVGFLLEAKMMGTPRHALNPREDDVGRRGSADIGKRVKEMAFKSIDLKGEHSRRRTMLGEQPVGGGAGGGDLTTWLHASPPRIYFFVAARVISVTDFNAVVRWCNVATQVVDSVGLYCYEPVGSEGADLTKYRRKVGVPAEVALSRTLYKACLDLQSLHNQPATSA
jgi:hypothetical protein